VQKALGRPRKFETIADPRRSLYRPSKWRLQLEASGAQWQEITLPLQSQKTVSVLRIRVRETVAEAWRRPGAERWLLIEKRSDGSHSYWVSNAGEDISAKQLILWGHQRWQVEQGYQQMKEELGLDHFEGRSWRGLHHHLTLCFMAYGFLRLEQARKKNEDDRAWDQEIDQRVIEVDKMPTVRARSSGAKYTSI
jgi:SRSO17 transposase